ncbi:hypothetical protein GW17_00019916 [Ensete ventricosum]|nr:hypothetical protein GW17_00019916 [Ensete ventricosum]
MVKVDFSDHVSLAKKEGTSMAGKGGSTRGMRQQKRWSISYRWTAEWRTDRVGADCRGRRHRGGKWGDGMAAAARHVVLWQGTAMLLGRWAASARGDGGQRRGQRLWLTRAMATAAIVGVGGDGSGCYGWLQHGGSAASRVAAKGEDEEVIVVKVCFPFFPDFRTTMLRSLL